MSDSPLPSRDAAAQAMLAAARDFYRFGWLHGTSGNLSARLSSQEALITASGRSKGSLTPDDFLTVDPDGQPTHKDAPRPSAETGVHMAIYRALPEVGAIYHVHHLHAALCGKRDFKQGYTYIADVEMIKGLGLWEPDASARIPIVENHHDLKELAQTVADFLDSDDFSPKIPGINLRNHGVYAWGKTPEEARRHIETFGYLFEYSWLSPMHDAESQAVRGFAR
ncbi:methylthioribulose 1-phosphate dehydratase [Lujinxingia litoralis]|uniref:Methylthioribulose-1-phosphate dehydratase n=1 Tax=Lujinxingia litoralis TaxID=2211119 RepID=A0A328C613_9DELT|nr:methylthioribulose 1-phosphate dehydratase [Lujinxingia litoralis]RAL21741.1 methylthioribulose 1-phosphate dehydratase [Lujinxingia litoralis]